MAVNVCITLIWIFFFFRWWGNGPRLGLWWCNVTQRYPRWVKKRSSLFTDSITSTRCLQLSWWPQIIKSFLQNQVVCLHNFVQALDWHRHCKMFLWTNTKTCKIATIPLSTPTKIICLVYLRKFKWCVESAKSEKENRDDKRISRKHRRVELFLNNKLYSVIIHIDQERKGITQQLAT